jgi:hypothetical protein
MDVNFCAKMGKNINASRNKHEQWTELEYFSGNQSLALSTIYFHPIKKKIPSTSGERDSLLFFYI